MLGGLDDAPRLEARHDELILSEADFDERTVLEIVEPRTVAGVKVRLAPDTTELLVQQGEYVPGQGVPLFELRPPVLTGADWAVKRDVRPRRGGARRRRRPAALAARSRSRSSSTRAAPCFYVDRRIGVGEREFGMLKFRTMVAERRRRSRPRSRTPTRRRARSSRSATTRA